MTRIVYEDALGRHEVVVDGPVAIETGLAHSAWIGWGGGPVMGQWFPTKFELHAGQYPQHFEVETISQ